MLSKNAKIYIAGHRGMVGSACWRAMDSAGYSNLLGKTSKELDLRDQRAVNDFIQEELEEYREACERGDIVEVLDALCDIAYVSIGNGTMLHGLKSKIWPAYQEVQASNMSKACSSEEEAMETARVRAEEQGEECYFEKVAEGRYIVYRKRDKKVMKSINYFRPDLKQFFDGN